MGFNMETVKNLRVLGFQEDIFPKMKELRKRYLELSHIRHPDKNTGTDEAFKEVLTAYNEIGKLIDENDNDDVTDTEENGSKNRF